MSGKFGSFFFTQNAIDRFREWYTGGMHYAQAVRELKRIAESACLLKERTRSGQEQWEASDGSGIIFVVKHDARLGKVCVTLHVKETPTSQSE